MTVISVRELQDTFLPLSEQLLRLNRPRKHLKGFLGRYYLELYTEEAFHQRKAISVKYQDLEAKCNQL